MIELLFSLCQVCHFDGHFLQALGPLVKSDALGAGDLGSADALNDGGGGLSVEELNLFLTVDLGEALGIDLQLGGVVGGIFADVAGGWNPDYSGHTHWRERADVPVVGVGGDGVVGHRFALTRLGKGRGLQGKGGGIRTALAGLNKVLNEGLHFSDVGGGGFAGYGRVGVLEEQLVQTPRQLLLLLAIKKVGEILFA